MNRRLTPWHELIGPGLGRRLAAGRRQLAKHSIADLLVATVLLTGAVGCFIFVTQNYPSFPAIRADSSTYLRFSWYRAPGLGLLAWGLYALTGTMHSVVFAQLGLGLASAVFFAWTLGTALGNRLLSLVLGLLLILNGSLRRMDLTLLTEALFVSFMLAAIAFGLRYWQHGRTRQLALASASVGLAMLMRPTAIAGVIPLLVCCLGRGRPSLRATLLGFAPLVTLLVIWSARNYVYYARPTPLLRGGLVLSAATVQYFTPDIEQRTDPILEKHAELVRQLPKITQKLRRHLDSVKAAPLAKREIAKRTAMLDVFYQRGRFASIGKRMTEYFGGRYKDICPKTLATGKVHRESCMDREFGALAKVAVAHEPWLYLHRVRDAWVWYTQETHDTGWLDRSRYHGTVSPGARRWWAKLDGVELGASRREYPALWDRPRLLHFWQNWMQTRTGKSKKAELVATVLGDVDRWTCLAVLGIGLVAAALSRFSDHARRLASSRALVIALVLYTFYAFHHLAGAAVHPAVTRYTLIMEPFAIAGLLTVIVGLARLCLRGTSAALARRRKA